MCFVLAGALQFIIILSVLGLASFSLAFILGCNNTKIAGITVPYHKRYVVIDFIFALQVCLDDDWLNGVR